MLFIISLFADNTSFCHLSPPTFLIHMAGSDPYFHTCCPYVSTFQNNENKFQLRIMAEWIIDDTCLVHRYLFEQGGKIIAEIEGSHVITVFYLLTRLSAIQQKRNYSK